MRRVYKWYFPTHLEVEKFLHSLADIPFRFWHTRHGWDIYLPDFDRRIGRYYWHKKRCCYVVKLW